MTYGWGGIWHGHMQLIIPYTKWGGKLPTGTVNTKGHMGINQAGVSNTSGGLSNTIHYKILYMSTKTHTTMMFQAVTTNSGVLHHMHS